MDDLEIEARRVFQRDLAAGPQDDVLDRVAVERALARVRQPRSFGARLRGWFRPAFGWAALGGAVAATMALVAVHGTTPIAPLAGNAPPAHALVLGDGSEIESESAPPAIQIAEQTPTRTTVRLDAGEARFHVRHDARRVFRVDAGAIQIEDLGTVFHVAHEPQGRVRVRVTEGRVAVLWRATGSRVELGAGDERLFGPDAAPAEPSSPAAEVTPLGPPPTLLPKANPSRHGSTANDPAHLLLSADEARRSGHPAAAVLPLKRLVDLYPGDPRAPSAAFTLGWILLTDLGRPREAALAFTEAERIAPRGTLAEDAAARVAEAWQKAGDQRRARAAARRYEQVYPAGRYVRLVDGIAGQH
jgi:transmembrane sensor